MLYFVLFPNDFKPSVSLFLSIFVISKVSLVRLRAYKLNAKHAPNAVIHIVVVGVNLLVSFHITHYAEGQRQHNNLVSGLQKHLPKHQPRQFFGGNNAPQRQWKEDNRVYRLAENGANHSAQREVFAARRQPQMKAKKEANAMRGANPKTA